MSELDSISNAITSATEVLQNAFGENTKLEGDVLKYLQEDKLTEIYLNELEHKSLSDFLYDIPESITKMRSSYLPVDLIKQITSSLNGSINEIISDSSSQKESFENTFMRMLGMPSSIEISQNLDILVISHSGERKTLDYTVVEKEILDERQKPRVDRKVLITNNIFKMDPFQYEDESLNQVNTDNNSEINLDLFVSNSELQDELATNSHPNLANIETELYQYIYLLIPPVQDSRISSCINEVNKIVPPNFSNKSSFQINSQPLRPSLLESVIRIRMDRLSGYSELSSISINDEEKKLSSDDYGVLESLFILRLRSSLRAFAIKLSHEIDSLRTVFQQTKKVPVADYTINLTAKTEEDARLAAKYKKVTGSEEDIAADDASKLYEKQKIIEDSIMALLDDNSKALDLQIDTQRKSSIKDSHLLSNLIGIIDLPRQRLEEKIKNKETGENNISDGPADKSREVISGIIGSSKGIGALHILVFMLALFTIPEDYLTGLLNKLEYEKFLDEFSGAGDSNGVFGNFGTSPGTKKIETATAINTLTKYILAGYDLFKEDLLSADSPLDLD